MNVLTRSTNVHGSIMLPTQYKSCGESSCPLPAGGDLVRGFCFPRGMKGSRNNSFPRQRSENHCITVWGFHYRPGQQP